MVTRAKKIADLDFAGSTITGGTIDGATLTNSSIDDCDLSDVSVSDGMVISNDGALPLRVDRGTDTSGSLIEFSNQGTLVGTFSYRGAQRLEIISDNVGLQWNGINNCILPVSTTSSFLDNTISLGFVGAAADIARFKDIHLGGTAYVGTDIFCDGKAKIGNVDNTGGRSLMVGDTGSNSGYAGFGVGMNHTITGDLNVVGGYGNVVSDARNAVFGSNNEVTTPANGVFGDSHTVNKDLSTGEGSGAGSLISGFENQLYNHTFNATVLGYKNKGLGNNSLTGGGYWTRSSFAKAPNSIAFGGGCVTESQATNSVALGALTVCGGGADFDGTQAMAIGYSTTAYGDNSLAGGNESISFGNTSFAFGNGCNASKGFSNIALGRGITTPASATAANLPGAVAVGQWNEWDVTTDQHFAVGTGTADGARYTSFYVGPRSTANANIVMRALKDSSNYINDNAAGLGGVPLGGLYRNSGYIKIRLT